MLVHIVVLLLVWQLLDEHVALVHIRSRLLLLLLQAGQRRGRIRVAHLVERAAADQVLLLE